MTQAAPSDAHAIIPLALLESIRRLDEPAQDGLDEFHAELAVKRLGMSPTVAHQIERFARLAARDERVDAAEVEALFRLIGRRGDADLVFADAGRYAGRLTTETVPVAARLTIRSVPAVARNRAGFALGRRAAARVFRVVLTRDGRLPAARLDDPLAYRATPHGASCGFYGSAIAEILRQLTDFDGAMLHVRCRSRGDDSCRWRAATSMEEE